MADSIFEPEISRSLKKASIRLKIPHSVAIECKKETGTSFGFDRVSIDQTQALLSFEQKPFTQKMLVAASVGGKSRFKGKTGFDFLCCPIGKSYVLVNFRATKKEAGKEIPKGTNKCFAIRINDFIQGKQNLFIQGRRSFPYTWFTENTVELKRTRWEVDKGYEYGWDLLPLFE